jgi:hypothetical protein
MPRWLLRLLYMFRGKRRVRLHLTTGPGVPDSDDGGTMTIEGLELGIWAGFHVLMLARVLDTEETSTELSGRTVEVPRDRVIFRQVLA